MFDPDARDGRLPALELVRLIASELDTPVIAAGGIMDGAGINRALGAGACAAQLGTAFIACNESLADEGFRAALASQAAHPTVMTRAISGRPARCLANRFTALSADIPASEVPAYPIAYDLGKSLNAAAKARGEYGYGAQWAGEGAPRFRAMPAGQLVQALAAELSQPTFQSKGIAMNELAATTFDLTRPTDDQLQQLAARMTDEERHVLLEHGTEAPFCGVSSMKSAKAFTPAGYAGFRCSPPATSSKAAPAGRSLLRPSRKGI